MASFYIPGSDLGASAKLNTLSAGAAANAVALGLSAGQLEAISDAVTAFSDALAAATEAKDAARGAVSTKDKARETAEEVAREYAQYIKTNPNATPNILAACGISPSPTPSGPLVPVTDVTAIGAANGTAEIKWKRNGNSKITTFVLQYRLAEIGPWLWLGSTTKTRFVDGGATPGVFKMYRILSQRAGATSAASNEAVIYGAELDETLDAAA